MDGWPKTLLWVTAVVGLLVGALRLTALRWWQVPLDDDLLAASLAPTLQAGDWIILWRATPPGFGDLVACPDPDEPGYMVLGRIAGEGRDHINITNSDVSVNKRKMATESACNPAKYDVIDPAVGSSVELNCAIEALGGVKHMRLNTTKKFSYSSVVPDDHVFLLSDDRHLPFDSRNYGAVERDTCKETVMFRLVGPGGFADVESRFTFID